MNESPEASRLVKLILIHPVVIIGGIPQENPFFVSSDELPCERAERAVGTGGASRA
jgi:hypothetical protein